MESNKLISSISEKDFYFVENIASKTYANVRNDFESEIKMKKFVKKPRVFFHEIISENLIELKFNEVVEFKNESKENIILKQNNIEINIDNFYFKNNSLFIEVNSLSKIEETFYQLLVKNIVNKFGEQMKGETRIFTVVYRSKYFRK